jgi:glycosyltransferase involved in cell wall biosynthesis
MEAPRKKIVVLAMSAIQGDARVQRQIIALAADHEVTVVGYGHLGEAARPHVRMRSLPPPWQAPVRYPIVLGCTALGRVAPQLGYWGWDSALRDHRAALAEAVAAQPDLIIGNDWQTLPIAVRARQRTGMKIVADLHEYAPLHWQSRKVWMQLIAPMIDWHLRNAVQHIAGAVAVNRTIADRYEREYGLHCEVVRNIPAITHTAPFRPTDPEHIRLVHHGNATRERRLDIMIHAIARADRRYSLHLRLIDVDRGYLASLRELAARVAPGRVHFEPPMAPQQIVATIAQYDMGIFVLPPVTFNYHAALPNKFFEFLFAGLATCIGPSPEMASIVNEYRCGVVVPSFDPVDVATHLDRLTAADIDAMKQRSIAACSHFVPENEMRVLLGVVAGVLRGDAT